MSMLRIVKHQKSIYILLICFIFFLLNWIYFFYGYLISWRRNLNLDTYVFPSYFEAESFQDYNIELGDSHIVVPVKGKPFTSRFHGLHSFTFDVFNTEQTINEDLSNCEKISQQNTVTISKGEILDVNLAKILSQFVEDYAENEYYQEVAPFFWDDLHEQLEKRTISQYWYQLAGSATWLEEYQLYFTIRRVIYSPSGAKDRPIISLTYAQLFDKDWKELENYHLVIQNSNDEESFTMKFPQFLNIPFYHDYDSLHDKFYGPEDPRILTFVNSKGNSEPIIVYNSDTRKATPSSEADGDPEISYYRAMYVCFPFQRQHGKINVDGSPPPESKNKIYIRSQELRIDGQPTMAVQKNWTPFISQLERSQNGGFDTHIQFIYKWSNLDVLKCGMEDGVCVYNYRLLGEFKEEGRIPEVGPLRGGTPLLSINELLAEHGIDASELLPPSREVWLGFARAHLHECGCGTDMYRPNLVVIVAELIDDKLFYKISHVSSYLSLDIKILPWQPNGEFCSGPDILIPNGISSWVLEDINDYTSDNLVLSYSVADINVGIIAIKGLLGQLLDNQDLFFAEQFSNYTLLSSTKGYNNDNVECAMQSSNEFCRLYGINYQDSS